MNKWKSDDTCLICKGVFRAILTADKIHYIYNDKQLNDSLSLSKCKDNDCAISEQLKC